MDRRIEWYVIRSFLTSAEGHIHFHPHPHHPQHVPLERRHRGRRELRDKMLCPNLGNEGHVHLHRRHRQVHSTGTSTLKSHYYKLPFMKGRPEAMQKFLHPAPVPELNDRNFVEKQADGTQ